MRVSSTLDPPIIFILFEEHSPFNGELSKSGLRKAMPFLTKAEELQV
jgi:hypothetical protein